MGGALATPLCGRLICGKPFFGSSLPLPAAFCIHSLAWAKSRGTPSPLAYNQPILFWARASPWSAAMRNQRIAIVPHHAPAVVVQYPNLVLGEGIALIRDLTEPAHRLAVVLRHTPSVFVEHPDITLGLDNSLVGGFAEPADRFAIVLCHPSSVTVEHPDFVLREGISLVCRRTYQRIASP